ncbi:hypothetical protein BKA70DRAFT_404471 [Coprinopsis sp. MPI-PUGE-AT-0042]|nr:hypothetical protein BKA70DRAFT_404471 [Coprinopsis sp. MPI-PUGE-AT-0042]
MRPVTTAAPSLVKALKSSPRISHCRAALHAQLGGSRPSSSSTSNVLTAVPTRSIPKSQTLRESRIPYRSYASVAIPSSSVASSSGQPDPAEHDPDEITDQEWELRTGRAIYVLQETLPTFFQTGLVTAIDKATGEPKPPHSTSSMGSGGFHIPLFDPLLHSSSAAASAPSSPSTSNSEHHHSEGEHGIVEEGEEGVYSPNVRLEYTPPVVLPSPFPKTFKVEGLNLYLASASLIRHAMNALYTDLDLTLVKVSVHTTPPPSSGGPGAGGGTMNYSDAGPTTSTTASPTSTTASASSTTTQITSSREPSSSTGLESHQHGPDPAQNSHLERSSQWEGHRTKPSRNEGKRNVNREKYLVVRKIVTGTNRVSGGVSEWEVESTYTFSPTSGLILRHAINWIHPAPHLAVYDSLRGGLGKVFGFGGAGAGVGVGVGGMGGA